MAIAEENTVQAAAGWIEKLKIKNGKYNADDNPNPGRGNLRSILQVKRGSLEVSAANALCSTGGVGIQRRV